jgi:NAD(P)-dependent dehydrogenase (short-subunit alcohol dehydrogenase family)
MTMTTIALIVGAGSGLSASIARLFAAEGMAVALAARRVEKLEPLIQEIGATGFVCDATQPDDVDQLFNQVEQQLGIPTVVIYNAGLRMPGSFIDLNPTDVAESLQVNAFGGFLIAHAAAKRMLQVGEGAIFFTGASASVKGYARSAPFAMGKFALRGLAQSMARELAPKNIHVAHFVIDGAIRSETRLEPADKPDSMLDPDAIAQTYLAILRQPRNAWIWEIELRPWVEPF